jgi:hypothetical protein
MTRLPHLLFFHPARGGNPTVPKIAVKITGGIGDAVVITRWLRDFLGSLQGLYTVDLYFKHHRTAQFLFAGIPGLRSCYDESLFNPLRRCYQASFYLNQFVDTWLGFRKELLIHFDPQLLNMVATIWWSRQKWKKYIHQHPYFDGAFANLAVLQGLRRETFVHAFTGTPYGGPLLSLDLGAPVARKHPALAGPYLTVHDGWDGGFTGLSSRPTKALLKEQWPLLVEKIKKLTPLKIVQIGGATGSAIPGVDLNLKGALTLQQSAGVLQNSVLHIDSESGLVHLASAVGTKSLVMFGPTNLAFFGYKENINVPPNQCGNCWWSKDDWMRDCPADYEAPLCMQTHDLDKIASLVAAEVSTRQAAASPPVLAAVGA